MGELRTWAILIPRIEEVLDCDLRSEYKIIVIKKIIEQERNKDDAVSEQDVPGDKND